MPIRRRGSNHNGHHRPVKMKKNIQQKAATNALTHAAEPKRSTTNNEKRESQSKIGNVDRNDNCRSSAPLYIDILSVVIKCSINGLSESI